MKDRCKSLLLKIKGICKAFVRISKELIGRGTTYGIYITIILISILIRVISFLLGNHSLDETINDIAIGAFSSTVVAWLILLEDKKRTKKRNEELCVYTLSPFFHALMNYMQSYCNFLTLPDRKKWDEAHTFSEWSNLYFSKLVSALEEGQKSDFRGMNPEFLAAATQRISQESKRITENAVWLQKEDILKEDENDVIYAIGCICDAASLYTGNLQSSSNLNLINDEICRIIENSTWKHLVEAQYSRKVPLVKLFIQRG